MKIKVIFILGLVWLTFLLLAYFININTFIPGDIVEENIRTSLLAIIIFYNPIILIFYIAVGVGLVIYGTLKNEKNIRIGNGSKLKRK